MTFYNKPLIAFWFRRDLRLSDNAGLYHALKNGASVLPVFIFDTDILDYLEKDDPRVTFMHQCLEQLDRLLKKFGSSLVVKHGKPLKCWQQLIDEYPIAEVYTNNDYEPYGRKRDSDIASLLQQNKIDFHSFKDHVIFEKNEIKKDDGKPYTVFTPYKRKWLEKLVSSDLSPYQTQQYFSNFQKHSTTDFFPPIEKI